MIARLLGLDRRSSLENPAVSLTDVDAWREAGWSGGPAASGERVTKKRALSNAAVWNAVALISGALARLPLEVFRRVDDMTRERDRTHKAYRLVRRRANPEMHALFFWRVMYVRLLLYTRAYAYIDQETPGQPLGLYPLLPDRTCVERMNGSQIYKQTNDKAMARELDGQLVYVTEVGGSLRTLYPSQVLHLAGLSLDGIDGLDLVEQARNAIGLGLAQEKFGSLFFKNGARMGGTLEIPAAMKKEAKDKLEEGFRKTYERSDSWFKTVVLRDNAKFHQASFNPRDSQLVEASENQVLQVARFFKLQPSKLGITGSSSYNSKSEDNQAFLDDTLSDHLALTTAECQMKLLSESEQESESHYFEHNTNALLRMDLMKRSSAYTMALRGRWLTRNEVRASENYPPVEGGDEFDPSPGAAPLNQPKQPPAKDDPAEDPLPDENRNVRAHSVLLIGRILARAEAKATKSVAAFSEWLSRDWLDLTEGYCGEMVQANINGRSVYTPAIADKLRSMLREKSTTEPDLGAAIRSAAIEITSLLPES
jgi:HK97 family phage portal protein